MNYHTIRGLNLACELSHYQGAKSDYLGPLVVTPELVAKKIKAMFRQFTQFIVHVLAARDLTSLVTRLSDHASLFASRRIACSPARLFAVSRILI